MYLIGIILAIGVALFKGLDTIINKQIAPKYEAQQHAIFRILFVMPLLLIPAVLHWKLETKAIPWVMFYGLLEALNIYFHQYGVRNLSAVAVESLSKTKILFVFLAGILIYLTLPAASAVIGVILFLLGMVITIRFEQRGKIRFTGILAELMSVLCRTGKPFVISFILHNEMATNESVTLISMVTALLLLLIAFRPSIHMKREDAKSYGIQSLFVAASMLATGYAVLYAGVLPQAVLENFSILFVVVFDILMEHQKPDKYMLLGNGIAILGAVIITIGS